MGFGASIYLPSLQIGRVISAAKLLGTPETGIMDWVFFSES